MHHLSAEEKARQGGRAALEKKAIDIVAFDLRGISDMADCFLICSGTTDRHVRAIADAIEEALFRVGVRMDHKEGYLEATWILLDYGDLVVHVFTEEKRRYYDLERLWGDAPKLDVSMNIPTTPLDMRVERR
ncbi:MAG: ribosome silencing factor [bacterium]|nr:ribosome silencing factor [bacterium]